MKELRGSTFPARLSSRRRRKSRTPLESLFMMAIFLSLS
jgi:hypothetical protein